MFPSPCGEIKGQNLHLGIFLFGAPLSCFRPLAGKLRAKTVLVRPWRRTARRFRPLAGKLRAKTSTRVPWMRGTSRFRPLAGKLRAKTSFSTGQGRRLFLWFPSPCGEIKGQNLARLHCIRFIFMFPSPCGEIKGQNWIDCSGRSSTLCFVSVPLREN